MDFLKINLHYNEVNLQDNIFWKFNSVLHYFDTSIYLSASANHIQFPYKENMDIRVNAKITVFVSAIKYVHYRNVYTFFDLLGAYGGLQGMILLIFGFFAKPYSTHSFLLEAIRKLYKI